VLQLSLTLRCNQTLFCVAVGERMGKITFLLALRFVLETNLQKKTKNSVMGSKSLTHYCCFIKKSDSCNIHVGTTNAMNRRNYVESRRK
jgi:hypothetical protein